MTNNPHPKITFTDDEGWMLIITLVRYSLGRQTYITNWCANIVIRNWDALTDTQRDQIKREISEYKKSFGFSTIDEPEWERILNAK